MLTIQATGKSVDAAIYNGLNQLGLSIDEVNIEVIQQASKGILGIGSKPAIVKLTEKPKEEVIIPDFALERGRRNERRDNRDARDDRDNRDERRQNARSERPERTDRPARPERAVKQEKQARTDRPANAERPSKVERPAKADRQPISERPAKPERADSAQKPESVARPIAPKAADEAVSTEAAAIAPRAEQVKQANRERRERKSGNNRPQNNRNRQDNRRHTSAAEAVETVQEPAPEITYTADAAANEPSAQFVSGLIEKMQIEGKVLAARDAEAVRLRIDCTEMGVLIGHRGETLDALQYLTGLVVNRNSKVDGYTRVTINTEDYREKREETLVRLAKRIASQVKATGSPRALEPMNPYERRIIHSALQKHPFVTTQSEGDEPNRRVVISPKRRQGGYNKSRREHA